MSLGRKADIDNVSFTVYGCTGKSNIILCWCTPIRHEIAARIVSFSARIKLEPCHDIGLL